MNFTLKIVYNYSLALNGIRKKYESKWFSYQIPIEMHDTFSKCRLQYYHSDQSHIHQETMLDINRYFYNIRE